jgi:protocatechuate 3,4-dioxygenase beta subunit
MRMTTRSPEDLRRGPLMGRRQVLGILGATGALLVVDCGDHSPAGSNSDGATSSPSTGGSTGDATTGDATAEAPTSGEATTGAVECGAPAVAWATGGTASMTAQDCYPNPFAGGVLGCAVICETTAGPCITATTPYRKDISEGFSGLPVRLSLLIVDAGTCEPIAGASVEIWHTQRTGIYSGVTPQPATCYLDDPEAAMYEYFRGSQDAGADGRVDFDTCYPGWYSGRAIHIHFRVIRDGEVYATSQLFFADDLNAEIFASHPEYSGFGQPDRTNISDGIIGKQVDKSSYVLDTARMPDGAMLASKVIAIRSSLQDMKCSV